MAVAVEVVVGVTRRVEEWDRLRPTTRGTEMGLLVVSGSLSVCAFSSSSSSVKDNTGSGIFSINCFALSFSQRILLWLPESDRVPQLHQHFRHCLSLSLCAFGAFSLFSLSS